MTITFKNKNEVTVSALKKRLSYTRNNQNVLLAQKGGWISSIVRFQLELIIYIAILHVRANIGKQEAQLNRSGPPADQKCIAAHDSISASFEHPERVNRIQNQDDSISELETRQSSASEDHIYTKV